MGWYPKYLYLEKNTSNAEDAGNWKPRSNDSSAKFFLPCQLTDLSTSHRKVQINSCTKLFQNKSAAAAAINCPKLWNDVVDDGNVATKKRFFYLFRGSWKNLPFGGIRIFLVRSNYFFVGVNFSSEGRMIDLLCEAKRARWRIHNLYGRIGVVPFFGMPLSVMILGPQQISNCKALEILE